MRRMRTWAITVAFLLMALASYPIKAAPAYPVCTVGPGMDYGTILAAVADGNCAIINVSPGTYYGRVDISRPLTLHSISGASATFIAGSSDQPYVVFISNTANVTLDGFTVTYPEYTGGSDASGIVVEAYGGFPSSGVFNIRITNSIIHDIGTTTRSPVAYGTIGINIGPVNGVEVDHNTIYSIHHGAISGNPIPWANAISIWGLTNNTTANINIHDNTMYDISSPTLFDAGISMQADVGNITIQNNRVTDTGEYGVESRGGILSLVYIGGNSISGATIAGIRTSSSYQDTITGNTLTGSTAGILVEDTSTTPIVHYNGIYDNTQWGLLNNSPNTTDAENNWWGHCSGPYHPTSNPHGLGNAASDNVDYNPWLHPCMSYSNPKRYLSYFSLHPLAENQIADANELRIEVEGLLRLAQEHGLDETQCKLPYEKGVKYLSDAQKFIQGNNFAAANNYAIYAEGEFRKARDCLKALIG